MEKKIAKKNEYKTGWSVGRNNGRRKRRDRECTIKLMLYTHEAL